MLRQIPGWFDDYNEPSSLRARIDLPQGVHWCSGQVAGCPVKRGQHHIECHPPVASTNDRVVECAAYKLSPRAVVSSALRSRSNHNFGIAWDIGRTKKEKAYDNLGSRQQIAWTDRSSRDRYQRDASLRRICARSCNLQRRDASWDDLHVLAPVATSDTSGGRNERGRQASAQDQKNGPRRAR